MITATHRLSYKVQELGPSGKWIGGRIHTDRADAQADALTRRSRARIKTVRN